LDLLKISGNQSFLTPLEGRREYPNSDLMPTVPSGALPVFFWLITAPWNRFPNFSSPSTWGAKMSRIRAPPLIRLAQLMCV
jgi:hypothetical protein